MMNQRFPRAGQIWEHVASGLLIYIIDITARGIAKCEIRPEGTSASSMYLDIPAEKFVWYGNRGFRFLQQRRVRKKKIGKTTVFGKYRPRRKFLGAI